MICIQRMIPNAYVVKGLNIVQAGHDQPSLTGGEPDMFIAGDDNDAKRTVTSLLEEFGWPVIDMVASRARAGWRPSASPGSSTPTARARRIMPSSSSVSEDSEF